ncbi:MAG TPA: THUMP domain-containing protein [Saprospiraceae bacterium]|nr:THUMP domain-containing protein [Saprospiraceae bacterium]HMP23189.1 THUMP domain-containing protein [Saprospiraceae bacterium]
MKIIVKTLHGLEPVLAEEIRKIGGQAIRVGRRAVECEGDLRLLYRANLELRTALRVLVHLADFRADSPDELYRKISRIAWQEHLSIDKTFAVDVTAHSEIFRHSKYAGLKTKDAIADYFRKLTGARPSVNVTFPHLRINLHINEDQCALSLDSSADSLHKRGYRATTLEAPINEVLAAGMILHTGWQGDATFIDPMCGSGTLLIEAGLIATGTPPQLHRDAFGFMRWRNFDAKLWEEVLEQAKAQIKPLACDILGFDKDMRAVRASAQNIFSAHLEGGRIRVAKQAFEKLTPPPPPGLLITNPPYDERLQEADVAAFYSMIGDRLKQAFAGYEAWLISSNLAALKHIGLRASQKMTLFNGALECKFQQYKLYEGSLDQTKTEAAPAE